MPDGNSFFRMTATATGATPIAVTPTLTVHADYAAGDYVGTSGEGMTFANAARIEGGNGIIVGAMALDGDKASVEGELWLFDSDPTPPADSAAWTITDANLARCVGVVSIKTYYAAGANSVGQSSEVHIPFKCASGSRDLVGCFVTRGAPAYTDQALTIVLWVMWL